MRTMGVTGGIGSGKSALLAYMEERWGAHVVRLDDVGKHLQKKGMPCYNVIAEQFGPSVVGADGELDRQRLAALIFQDETAKKRLEGIVHPAVMEWVKEDLARAADEKEGLYVMESAILYTSGFYRLCGEIIEVCVPAGERIKRLLSSRGGESKKWEAIIKSQEGTDRPFVPARVYTVDNSGDFSSACRQIDKIIGG